MYILIPYLTPGTDEKNNRYFALWYIYKHLFFLFSFCIVSIYIFFFSRPTYLPPFPLPHVLPPPPSPLLVDSSFIWIYLICKL